MELIITKHAQQRMKERVGIKSAERMYRLATCAFEKGFSMDNTDCMMILRSFEKIDQEKYPNRILRMYNEQIYVFLNNLLLTVLPVDSELRKKMEKKRSKMNKRKVAA